MTQHLVSLSRPRHRLVLAAGQKRSRSRPITADNGVVRIDGAYRSAGTCVPGTATQTQTVVAEMGVEGADQLGDLVGVGGSSSRANAPAGDPGRETAAADRHAANPASARRCRPENRPPQSAGRHLPTVRRRTGRKQTRRHSRRLDAGRRAPAASRGAATTVGHGLEARHGPSRPGTNRWRIKPSPG